MLELSIAHMDCDAFYASIEKRDNPDLVRKPLIIGGGRRGVVSTACYVARVHGVRSAMPMFKALKLCPDAVVLKPRMEVYSSVSREIRSMMEELTPDVEPLSLDEAFMDLSGTLRLHGAPPALMLAKLIKRMRDHLGLTGSIGLSHNKFLAKVASDMDKPHGFQVIGKAETEDFLCDKPVSLIWGIGKVTASSLESSGIRTFRDLRRWSQADLHRRFGTTGDKLWHLARGRDNRSVSVNTPSKSISNETTFEDDTDNANILDGHIWRLSENVSARAKAKDIAGRVVTLKLKHSDHRIVTRRISLEEPTQLADEIYRAARKLMDHEGYGKPYRLAGVGISELVPDSGTGGHGDLLDPHARQRTKAERATDSIREKFGKDAIKKGRSLR